ncbi:MAG: Fic family protein [Nevskiaceae bacterium]|jgi:Fic family protein|nr:Fic family protein [Nevskiaceae bacterium]
MNTLALFTGSGTNIPASTSWYVDVLAEFRGKQKLYTQQSPQKLKVLREHALIESAVSSNRIEGVAMEAARIPNVLVATKPLFRDRDEEEIRGYRDALTWIHEQTTHIPINEPSLKTLHRMARGQIWDAGEYKLRDGDIIERNASGVERVRFRPVPANETSAQMSRLIQTWNQCQEERWVPTIIAVAAFNLDFLCIHPFRDGNGRVSRLALLLQTYHAGMEVGRYISLERLVEQNKDRYYQTLEQSSFGWHEARHDPWPFINYVLDILRTAYREFEERVGQMTEPRGAKAELVRNAVRKCQGEFRLVDIERACPGVGREWIRTVLADMKKSGELTCTGRGMAARWRQVTDR